ncbi:MAG: hypothetical protein E7286_10765 [Lachnospiraceae bacterium]|nr:hypothetical protein [Lachnospiraceae bacterium]
MKKKTKKIFALILALALIAGVCVFANGVVGNPVSKWLATSAAQKRLAEVYADKDYEVERVTFSFKDGNYHAFIVSPSSPDSEFSMSLNWKGQLRWDGYEERVLSGENTAARINKEYRAATEAVFTSPAFPYYSHIEFGDIEFISREWVDAEDLSRYALFTEDLELDQVYDIRELGKTAGHLVLYVYDEDVSVEKAAEILLEVKHLMDAGGVSFHVIDLVLEYPKPEDDSPRKEGRVETMEFLYDDIYEEGLVERVDAANEAAIAHHAKMDAENAKIIEGMKAE